MSTSKKLDSNELTRRDLMRWAGLAGVGGLGAVLPGCSQPPDQEIVSSTTQPTALRIGGSVTGRVTGLFGGNSVTNATVTITGIGSTTTDALGNFSFRIDRNGDFELIISGGGFLERRTAIRVTGNVNVNATVQETSGGFGVDDGLVNQFARRSGPSFGAEAPNPGAIMRWESAPLIRLYTRISGTGDSLTDERIDDILAVINRQYGNFTAGVLGFTPQVVQIDAEPPAPSALPLGTLCFYQKETGGGGAGFGQGSISSPGAIATSFCFTNDEADDGVLSRVFGQALGAGGVGDATESVMNEKGLEFFTEEDLLAARVLYGRPSGNTAPDTDPPGYFIAGD